MEDEFVRTKLLIGEEGIQKLSESRVAIFGIGGVGGYVTEGLARAGVGYIDIIDNDDVSVTNINRQIIATYSTVGKAKVDVMKDRILDINPNAHVKTHKCFYLPENSSNFDFSEYDYIIDAVDTVTAKLELIKRANEIGTRIISCMGTGNKLNPLDFKITDIYQTSVCPLAKVMRRELKKRGIEKLKVLYSSEKPIKTGEYTEENVMKRTIPGSISYVPPIAGLMIAGEVIKDLLGRE